MLNRLREQQGNRVNFPAGDEQCRRATISVRYYAPRPCNRLLVCFRVLLPASNTDGSGLREESSRRSFGLVARVRASLRERIRERREESSRHRDDPKAVKADSIIRSSNTR